MPATRIDPLRLYIRAHGQRWQARVPLDRLRSLNLGSYPTFGEARLAVRFWIRHGRVPDCVLPRWVHHVPIGHRCRPGYYAVVRAPKARARLGPFGTPTEAHAAAVQHLIERLGKRAVRYLGPMCAHVV